MPELDENRREFILDRFRLFSSQSGRMPSFEDLKDLLPIVGFFVSDNELESLRGTHSFPLDENTFISIVQSILRRDFDRSELKHALSLVMGPTQSSITREFLSGGVTLTEEEWAKLMRAIPELENPPGLSSDDFVEKILS